MRPVTERDERGRLKPPGALATRATHLELTPTAHLGITSALVGFGQFDHATRGQYGVCQIAGHACAFLSREITNGPSRLLPAYASCPLYTTAEQKKRNFCALLSGYPVLVAIIAGRDTVEDSIVINQKAVDMGLFRYYKVHSCVAKESGVGSHVAEVRIATAESFKGATGPPLPASVHSKGVLNERHYDPTLPEGTTVVDGMVLHDNPKVFCDWGDGDGIIQPGAHVQPGQPLVLMLRSWIGIDGRRYQTNVSVLYNGHGVGHVTKVVAYPTGEGELRAVRVEVVEKFTPGDGDKLTNRHAQKGTISGILRQEDMPYTKQGISPDMIVNPHQSLRMTIGQQVESAAGLAAAVSGVLCDATPYRSSDSPQQELSEKTAAETGKRDMALDVSSTGYFEMFDGATGKSMGRVFMGFVQYDALPQRAALKAYARAKGPVDSVTRQPNAGRKKKGGMRIGIMEAQAIIGSGAGAPLQSLFNDQSDGSNMAVCRRCRRTACHDNRDGRETKRSSFVYCKSCGVTSPDEVVNVRIPHSSVLLAQELTSVNIGMRFVTKDASGRLQDGVCGDMEPYL